MAQRPYKVYSLNMTGSVSVMFEGTYKQCRGWLRRRAQQGLPTHFYVVSSMDAETVRKRFNDI